MKKKIVYTFTFIILINIVSFTIVSLDNYIKSKEEYIKKELKERNINNEVFNELYKIKFKDNKEYYELFNKKDKEKASILIKEIEKIPFYTTKTTTKILKNKKILIIFFIDILILSLIILFAKKYVYSKIEVNIFDYTDIKNKNRTIIQINEKEFLFNNLMSNEIFVITENIIFNVKYNFIVLKNKKTKITKKILLGVFSFNINIKEEIMKQINNYNIQNKLKVFDENR